MKWSDEDVDLLCELWKKGLSASTIAKQIGKSRNACIGKAHRLALDPRSNKKFQKTETIFVNNRELTQKGTIPLAEIKPNQCRFMGGGLDDFLCCGEDIYKNSYCEKHHKMSIEPKQPGPVSLPENKKLGHLLIEI